MGAIFLLFFIPAVVFFGIILTIIIIALCDRTPSFDHSVSEQNDRKTHTYVYGTHTDGLHRTGEYGTYSRPSVRRTENNSFRSTPRISTVHTAPKQIGTQKSEMPRSDRNPGNFSYKSSNPTTTYTFHSYRLGSCYRTDHGIGMSGSHIRGTSTSRPNTSSGSVKRSGGGGSTRGGGAGRR